MVLPATSLTAHDRRWRRGVGLFALGFALVLGPVACSDDDSGEDASPTEAVGADETDPSTTEPSEDEEGATEFSGVLAEPESADSAYTYADPAPEGAEMTVVVTEGEDATTFVLEVAGFEPDRGYAVHAHVNPCGTTGDDAGPHFQNEVDPAATPDEPSADPAYANPENEVWLDLSTDADGAGTGEAEVPFALGDDAPASIIVHAAMETAIGPGEAGMAGDRLACLDMPLQ